MYKRSDFLLIGSGIMSATLSSIISELDPKIKITILEKESDISNESSNAWNNAGTGHSSFCELNYTPIKDDNVDISKAIEIAKKYEKSKQYWSYLLDKNIINNPKDFIRKVPHISFVKNQKDVEFLEKRYNKMKNIDLFNDMKFSKDPSIISKWIPIVMNGRNDTNIAATYMDIGTDVNFGELSKKLINSLIPKNNFKLFLNTKVVNIKKHNDKWVVICKNNDTEVKFITKYLFIGAGGASINLLEMSEIPESKNYGGFPVSGKWLVCKNDNVIKSHNAKVYGKAPVGSPPMSVPHIDTRIINGKKELLFGPYAGFTTKFLKNGSYLDLFKSITFDNLPTMITAGIDNIPLTKYLIEEVSKSKKSKFELLKEYYPEANEADWDIYDAGKRVQVIKKGVDGRGVIEFGTEIVISEDKTLSTILGASPGASTSVSIILELINNIFESKYNNILNKIFKDYNSIDELRNYTNKTLDLK